MKVFLLSIFVVLTLLCGARTFDAFSVTRLSRELRAQAQSGILDPNVMKRLEQASQQDPERADQLGKLIQQRALTRDTVGEQVQEFCRALAAFRQGLALDPRNGRLLVRWANVRQLVGVSGCDSAKGSFSEAARFARTLEPQNPGVLLTGAMLERLNGDAVAAAPLIRSFIVRNPTPSAEQIALILSSIRDEHDVLAMIPPVFPQVIDWSERIQKRPDFNTEQVQRTLEQVQIDALKTVMQRADLSQLLRSDWVFQVRRVAATDNVRQEIDRDLAQFDVEDSLSPTRDYLLRRSTLVSVPLTRGYLRPDAQPESGFLLHWNDSRYIAFDEQRTSIGFVAAPGTHASLVELVTGETAANLDPSEVDLFVSNDNILWRKIVPVDSGQVTLRGERIAWFSLPPIAERMVKLHFALALQRRSFVNEVSDIVRAYESEAEHD